MRPNGFFDEYRVGFTQLGTHYSPSNVFPYYRFYSAELHGQPPNKHFCNINIREFYDLRRLLGARILLEAKGCYDLWDLNQAETVGVV